MVSPLATMPSRGMLDSSAHGNGGARQQGEGGEQGQQGDSSISYHEQAAYRIPSTPYQRHETYANRQQDVQEQPTYNAASVSSQSAAHGATSTSDGAATSSSPLSQRDIDAQGNTASSFYTHGSYNVQPHSMSSHYSSVPLYRPRLVDDVKSENKATDGSAYQDYYSGRGEQAQQQAQSQMQGYQQSQGHGAQRLYHSQSSYGQSAVKAHQHIDTEAFASVDHAAAANLALASRKPIARKGRWSAAEDQHLRESVAIHGPSNWKQVAKDVGTRTGDQCWKRWNDALRPDLVHSTFTAAEDEILETAVHDTHGRSWSKIAKELLHGRCGLACKNRFDHIERKRRRKQVSIKHGASASMSAIDGRGQSMRSSHFDESTMRRLGSSIKSMHGYHSTRGLRHHRTRSSLDQALQQNLSASPTSIESPSYSSSLALENGDGSALRYYGRHSDSSTGLPQTRTFISSEPTHFSGGTFSTSSFSNFRWPPPTSQSQHQHGSADDVGAGPSFVPHTRAAVSTLLGTRQYVSNAHPYASALASRSHQYRLLGPPASSTSWPSSSSTAANPFGSHTISSTPNHAALQHPSTLFSSEASSSSSPTDMRSTSTYNAQVSGQTDSATTSPATHYGDGNNAADTSMTYSQQYAGQPQPQSGHAQQAYTSSQELQARASASSMSSLSVSHSTTSASLVTPVEGSGHTSTGLDYKLPSTDRSVLHRDADGFVVTSTSNAVSQHGQTQQSPAQYTSSPTLPAYMTSAGRQVATLFDRPSTMSWNSRPQNGESSDGGTASVSPTTSNITPHVNQGMYALPSASMTTLGERRPSASEKTVTSSDVHYSLQSNLLLSSAYDRGHEHDSTDAPDKQASYAMSQSTSPLEERVNDSGLEVSSGPIHVPFDGGGNNSAGTFSKYAWPHQQEQQAGYASQRETTHPTVPQDDRNALQRDADGGVYEGEDMSPAEEDELSGDDTVHAEAAHDINRTDEHGHQQPYHLASIAALVARDVADDNDEAAMQHNGHREARYEHATADEQAQHLKREE